MSLSNEYSNFTDEELRIAQKRVKAGKTINAFLIGIMFGVFVYSAVKNGFGFFTFFPLIIVYVAFRNKKDTKALEEELKKRKLE